MSVFQEKVFVQSLPQWLEIATKDLTTPAKERIGQEIEAHFAAAVESQTENGIAQTEAQKKAIEELGDASAAAKRFRRHHLTEKEVISLQKRIKYNSTRWIWLYFIFSPLSGLLFYIMFDSSRPHILAVCSIFALTNMFFAMARYFAANRKQNSAYLRFLILIEILEQVLYLGVMTMGYGWVFLVGGFTFGIPIALELRLYFKLRRIPNVWQEMPPQNGAVA